jgi:sugar phosphate isomerase/epimerase
MDFKLGIQSYCFRKYKDIDGLTAALRKAELGYVEIWPGHVSFEQSTEEIRKALKEITDAGITVSSYGQVSFKNDEDIARKAFHFAREAQIAAITANPDPEAYKLLDGLCEEYGVNLAVHNHGRNHRYGTTARLEEMLSRTSKRFGICLDTAWFFDAGEDPFTVLEKYRDRLYGVHLKDFGFDEEGNAYDVIIGEGKLDLPRFMKELANIEYSGYLSIEYEGDADNPVPNTVRCVKAVQGAIDEV